MSTYTIEFYIERCPTHGSDLDACNIDVCDIKELVLKVVGDVQPVVRGVYSGPPERCYPDEGGEVEVESVTCEGKDFDTSQLTKDELDAIDYALFEAMSEDDDFGPEYEPDDDY